MNTVATREIIDRIARLAELVASFNASYGRDYRIDLNSPNSAVELYNRIMNEQQTIAGLLTPEAVEKPFARFGAWWNRRSVMDLALINEMASAAFDLIGRYAYAVEDGRINAQEARSILLVQQSIAGMLHPDALRSTEGSSYQEAV